MPLEYRVEVDIGLQLIGFSVPGKVSDLHFCLCQDVGSDRTLFRRNVVGLSAVFADTENKQLLNIIEDNAI